MNKKFFNFDNSDGSAVTILAALTFYLFIVILVLSFLLVNIYGESIPSITLPSSKNIQEFSNEQNYQGGEYDLSLNANPWWGAWEYINGTGLQLTSINLIRPYSYVTLRYIQEIEGVYTNTYYINNSVHGDYCVGMRITFGSDTNEVCVNSEGIYIPDYFDFTNTVWGNHAVYTYPNANQIDNVIIKTVYNEELLEAEVYFNGDKIIITNELEGVSPLSLYAYYGGVSSNTIGFVLEKFETENPIAKTTGESNILTLLSDLLKTFINISLWKIPPWILPTELVAIFITLPEAGIIACIAFIIIRGID